MPLKYTNKIISVLTLIMFVLRVNIFMVVMALLKSHKYPLRGGTQK
jgi:hypothetical protein